MTDNEHDDVEIENNEDTNDEMESFVKEMKKKNALRENLIKSNNNIINNNAHNAQVNTFKNLKQKCSPIMIYNQGSKDLVKILELSCKNNNDYKISKVNKNLHIININNLMDYIQLQYLLIAIVHTILGLLNVKKGLRYF